MGNIGARENDMKGDGKKSPQKKEAKAAKALSDKRVKGQMRR